MSVLDRDRAPKPPAPNKLRALNDSRVSPGETRRSQVPQSKVAPAPPKGRNNTGIKVKGR